MNNKGSEWRKWDLHIHTPASFHWNGGKRLGAMTKVERVEFWDAACAAMRNTDVAVFGVQDYFTFDGFRSLVEDATNIERPPVLPGIELRVEAPVDFRLNFHVTFSPDVPLDRLDGFIHGLRIGATERSPTRTNLIEFARQLDGGKLKHHGFSEKDRTNDEEMLRLGFMTATVTPTSVKESLKSFKREEYLVIQPYDTNDGLKDLNWRDHAHADAMFFRFADMFETRKQTNVDLFLGKRTSANEAFFHEFLQCIGGLPKPVCSGSDAHRVADYGVFPNNRVGWFKARPTFEGLCQSVAEPALRCFVGEEPPKRRTVRLGPTRHMKRIAVKPNATTADGLGWFDVDLELNEGLVAIIGNKGAGKTALADIIARCADAGRNGYTFLTSKRFRRPPNPSEHFDAHLEWHDGTCQRATLSTDPAPDAPERLRYLPQHYIERLCNEISAGTSAFEQEIRDVIFRHTDGPSRLGARDLDELIELRTREFSARESGLSERIRSSNRRIDRLRRESSAQNVERLRRLLEGKSRELTAHDSLRPSEVLPPGTELDPGAAAIQELLERRKSDAAQLEDRITRVRHEQTLAKLHSAAASRLLRGLASLRDDVRARLHTLEEDASVIGLDLAGLVTFSVRREPIETIKEASDKVAAETGELLSETGELPAQLSTVSFEIQNLQEKLSAPARAYEAYLSRNREWQVLREQIVGSIDVPGSISALKAELTRATSIAKSELAAEKTTRQALLTEAHGLLLNRRALLVELFAPVEKLTSDEALAELPLEFSATLSARRFTDRFLAWINQRRRGAFSGSREGQLLVDRLLDQCDWESSESVVLFIEKVMEELEKEDVDAQLLGERSRVELEDFLFSLEYVDVHYTLMLGGRNIESLSPGERGAMLIAFYLLLDPEGVPLIIDQPEENLDNETVFKVLVPCFRRARESRQVIIVTHSPNIAIVADADQIIRSTMDKTDNNRVEYEAYAIEDPRGNHNAVSVLEGTWPAFRTRAIRYGKRL